MSKSVLTNLSNDFFSIEKTMLENWNQHTYLSIKNFAWSEGSHLLMSFILNFPNFKAEATNLFEGRFAQIDTLAAGKNSDSNPT